MGSAGAAPSSRALLAPRYWGSWLSVGLLRAAVVLPYPWQSALGRGVGRVLYRLLPRRRAIAATNLALCFPEWTDTRREQTLRGTFESVGIALFEFAMAWWASTPRLQRLGRIEGLEHLRRALEAGRGAILLTAHFTTLEIGGRLLMEAQPFTPMYRRTKNPVWDRVVLRGRQRHASRALERHDVRGLLRALRANEPVWYAPDQDYGREHSVFVPFFGVPAATITATARLAAMSGAPVVPFFQHRLEGGAGYRLTVHPPLDAFPGPDPEVDARRVNALIEAEVRAHPAQYLWTHRRFKTRPPGLAGVYPD